MLGRMASAFLFSVLMDKTILVFCRSRPSQIQGCFQLSWTPLDNQRGPWRRLHPWALRQRWGGSWRVPALASGASTTWPSRTWVSKATMKDYDKSQGLMLAAGESRNISRSAWPFARPFSWTSSTPTICWALRYNMIQFTRLQTIEYSYSEKAKDLEAKAVGGRLSLEEQTTFGGITRQYSTLMICPQLLDHVKTETEKEANLAKNLCKAREEREAARKGAKKGGDKSEHPWSIRCGSRQALWLLQHLQRPCKLEEWIETFFHCSVLNSRPPLGLFSRKSQQRIGRRRHFEQEVDHTVDALNTMYGKPGGPHKRYGGSNNGAIISGQAHFFWICWRCTQESRGSTSAFWPRGPWGASGCWGVRWLADFVPPWILQSWPCLTTIWGY